jgi:uncharacterized protein YceK
MQAAKTLTASLLLAAVSLASTGCATVSTISAVEPGSPKVLSGTRLDISAIEGDEIAIRKFKAAPPVHAILDLPFSVFLDLLIFPLTFSVATYEVLFGTAR